MVDPIQPKYHTQMNDLARELDGRFNGINRERTIGFALFVFDLNLPEGNRTNYISNASRADMIASMKEWIARAEGQPAMTGRA